MFRSIALTLESFKIILNPASTVFAFAVPPTSRKLAGSPPSQKLNNILEKYNLIKMEVNKEDVFDLELHEAITNTPAGKKLKGKIVDIIEEGYLIGEKIIRHAKVVIGS